MHDIHAVNPQTNAITLIDSDTLGLPTTTFRHLGFEIENFDAMLGPRPIDIPVAEYCRRQSDDDKQQDRQGMEFAPAIKHKSIPRRVGGRPRSPR